jgi:DNA-binding MarR family transcriptional regulator
MTKPFYDLATYGARNSIGCKIRQLNNLMVPRAEARFSDQELTFSHWLALMALRDGIADTGARLSRHMNYDSGAITRLIDQLEERGLVERTRSKSDRRVVRLALTKQGQAMWKRLTPPVVEYWNDLLDGFSRSEAETLVTLLTRLLARMEELPEKVPAKVKAAS